MRLPTRTVDPTRRAAARTGHRPPRYASKSDNHEKPIKEQIRIDISVPVHLGELRYRSDRRVSIYPRTFTGDSNRVFADNLDFRFDHIARERR